MIKVIQAAEYCITAKYASLLIHILLDKNYFNGESLITLKIDLLLLLTQKDVQEYFLSKPISLLHKK